MLSNENQTVIQQAEKNVREANRYLAKGDTYAASQCCRLADEQFTYVRSQPDVTFNEVDDYVKRQNERRSE